MMSFNSINVLYWGEGICVYVIAVYSIRGRGFALFWCGG
jgi:hypothetical protein